MFAATGEFLDFLTGSAMVLALLWWSSRR